MSLFRGLSADRRPLEEFRAAAPKVKIEKNGAASPFIPLHVFEWSQSSPDGIEIGDLRSVEQLNSQSQGTIRVIFAPRDVPTTATVDGFVELFEDFNIPSAFISEGLQGVSQSFAVQENVDGTTYVWCHILCKDIAVSNNKVFHLQDPDQSENSRNRDRLEAQRQSNASFSWSKLGFVMRVRDQRNHSSRPNRTVTASSDSTLAPVATQACVELFCFGAPVTIRDRMQKLKGVAAYDDLLQDPYVFLEIILEEMYKILDRTGWAISDIFGTVETRTLGMACTPGKANKMPNDHFTALHNLAKHVIYLRENCDCALATLDELREHHKRVIGDRPSPAQELTRQALNYRKTLFQSTQRRLASLDARMANMIQLSFHIVTQGDSRVMQTENQSMKTIAVMTLVFMPLGTVASIFGTQFMKLQEDSPFHLRVSQDFWLLWVIAVPLTVIVLVVWRVWYFEAKGRLIEDWPQRPEGEHGYMGWKTLQQTLRRDHGSKKGQYVIASREVPSKV